MIEKDRLTDCEDSVLLLGLPCYIFSYVVHTTEKEKQIMAIVVGFYFSIILEVT